MALVECRNRYACECISVLCVYAFVCEYRMMHSTERDKSFGFVYVKVSD